MPRLFKTGITSEGTITGDKVVASNNGNGQNVQVGDDVWLGDINVANTMSLKGQQSATSGYIRFGGDSNAFGYDGTKLSYAGNLTTSGLTLSSTTSPIILNASAGTSGQVLTSAGAGATPTWTTMTGGYTLPTATATTLGGIELFSATTQTTAANAVTTTASRTYGLQLNSDLQGVVNVPWTDTNTFPTTWTWTAGTTAGPTASITGTSSTITVAAVPAANDTTASGVVTTGTQTFGGAKTFSSAVTAAGLTTTAAVNLNYASPTIASNNASAASIFTGTVTGVTIGSSTIRTTAFPADATTATATVGAGFMGMPQNSRSASYTLVAADAGKHIYMTATGFTITIPLNSSVAFPVGTTITFVSGNGVSTTITCNDTFILAGTGTASSSKTLAAYGVATAIKIASTTWIISGNGLT